MLISFFVLSGGPLSPQLKRLTYAKTLQAPHLRNGRVLKQRYLFAVLETGSRNGLPKCLSCLSLRWDYPELLHETFCSLAFCSFSCHKNVDGEPATFLYRTFLRISWKGSGSNQRKAGAALLSCRYYYVVFIWWA